MSLQKLKNVYFLGSLIKNIKGIYDKVNEIIDYLNDNPVPTPVSKRYIASVNWGGTSVSWDETLNELGGTVTLTHDGTGYVAIEGIGLMGAAEINSFFTCTDAGNNGGFGMTWSDVDFIYLNYVNQAGNSANPIGSMIKISIEIFE